MATKNNPISIGGAVVYKESRGKRFFWLIGTEGNGWEIPKVTARRGESSVRAALRMAGETAGMNTKVLEEVGRHSTMVLVNGKPIAQRLYYYLLVFKSAGEVLGFTKSQWMNYKKALKAITLKREKEVLKSAEDLLRQWDRERKKKK